MHGVVTAVSCSLTHSFAKANQESIRLLPGLGVEGDAHLGADLSVEALAQRACLGPRQFNRRFQASLGCTPARYVEDARMREACRRLSLGRRDFARLGQFVRRR